MMNFFRPDQRESGGSTGQYVFWGAVVFIIVVSFFWQMSLGLCPVP